MVSETVVLETETAGGRGPASVETPPEDVPRTAAPDSGGGGFAPMPEPIIVVEAYESVAERPEPSTTTASEVAVTPLEDIVATRVFAGPSEYPPAEFKAYGILAFPARATSQTLERHSFICEAYLARLPHADEVSASRSVQMVTVWPMRTDGQAANLNALSPADTCARAVTGYGLVAAHDAIKDARKAGHRLEGRGPYLLAWSPASDKGRADVLVLSADLSNVSTAEGARNVMHKWAQDIEKQPDLWSNGWDLEKVRLAIQLWVDRFGENVLLAIKEGT
ncbi:MAG: hypothetical protein HWE23_10795 [Rhodobacteraceae bacterium]|nr:hypothetical protein [Paracoccaceae bacterium]